MRTLLSTIHNLVPQLGYVPNSGIMIDEPCHILADTLMDALQNSNGLEFMPREQRLALILMLSQDAPDVFKE